MKTHRRRLFPACPSCPKYCGGYRRRMVGGGVPFCFGGPVTRCPRPGHSAPDLVSLSSPDSVNKTQIAGGVLRGSGAVHWPPRSPCRFAKTAGKMCISLEFIRMSGQAGDCAVVEAEGGEGRGGGSRRPVSSRLPAGRTYFHSQGRATGRRARDGGRRTVSLLRTLLI